MAKIDRLSNNRIQLISRPAYARSEEFNWSCEIVEVLKILISSLCC